MAAPKLSFRSRLVIWAAKQQPPLYTNAAIALHCGISAGELSDIFRDNPRRTYVKVRGLIQAATGVKS